MIIHIIIFQKLISYFNEYLFLFKVEININIGYKNLLFIFIINLF